MLPGAFCAVKMGKGRPFAAPGSVAITATGEQSFTVPKYRNSLTIEFFGGGGGGGGAGGNYNLATPGGDTYCTAIGMIARGGTPGGNSNSGENVGVKGTGGTASGGDVNTSGGNGSVQNGGDCPNGGVNGGSGTVSTGVPGAGGNGRTYSPSVVVRGGGAGAGAYCSKTFARGALSPGALLQIFVGVGGQGGFATVNGQTGARGEARISWT